MPGSIDNLKPYFSIIIPCYNQAHFIGDAVQSILKQEWQDFEIIIVNDGSTDNIIAVTDQWTKTDSRIRLINKSNGGLSSARNAGLSVASGHVIQFLDADDFLKEECLQNVHSVMQYTASNSLVRVGYSYVKEDGQSEIHHVQPPEITDAMLFVLSSNLGPCHSIFIHKELAVVLGGFDESLKSVEDWDFWIRAIKAGAEVITLAAPLVGYRYVSNSMSRDAFRMYEALDIVTRRAPLRDTRIVVDSMRNHDYEYDIRPVLKFQLLRCLGVAVMQGKVAESVSLYQREKTANQFEFTLGDYANMSTYLSFRYFRSREELDTIFIMILPRFNQFFVMIGKPEGEIKRILKVIFKSQLYLRNHYRFGKYFGAVVNRLLLI